MSYYSRPQGDYKTYGYAGDPGFLSSLWKGIKSVGKTVLTAAFPIPAAIIGGVTQPKRLPAPPGIVGPMTGVSPGFMPGVGARGPSMPGWMPGPSAGSSWDGVPAGWPRGPTRGSVAIQNGCCPQGFHPEKATKAYCVRNRRMNIANPRALRRGMRRVQGFEKLARRTISFTRRVKMKKGKSS